MPLEVEGDIMNRKIQSLLLSAIMGALAYLLMYFSFPVMPALPYLKIDFSDIPILLVAFVEGPIGATLSAFIAKFLHYVFTGGEMGIPIGDFTSFLATLAYTLPIYYILKKPITSQLLGYAHQTKKNFNWRAIGSYALATLSLTIVMTVLNYYIITPFYMYVMNFPIDNIRTYILFGIIPFNLLKGLLVSIMAHIVVVKVLPTLIQKFGFAYPKSEHS